MNSGGRTCVWRESSPFRCCPARLPLRSRPVPPHAPLLPPHRPLSPGHLTPPRLPKPGAFVCAALGRPFHRPRPPRLLRAAGGDGTCPRCACRVRSAPPPLTPGRCCCWRQTVRLRWRPCSNTAAHPVAAPALRRVTPTPSIPVAHVILRPDRVNPAPPTCAATRLEAPTGGSCERSRT